MTNFKRKRMSSLAKIASIALLSLLVAAGCGDDEEENNGNNGTVTDTGADTGAEDTGAEDTGPEDTGPDGTEDTGPDGTDDTGPDATNDTGPDATDDTGDAGTMSFTFSTGNPVDNATDFTQVDRMGMPAVSTALIPDGKKTAYNQAAPAGDAANFAGDIVGTLAFLHSDAIDLDSDLESLGLVPCKMQNSMASDECVSQDILGNVPGATGPSPAQLVLPDTLKIDVSAPAGFPNGRALADPVVDVTLAILLLDMDAMTTGTPPAAQTPFAFTPGNIVGPLNPPTNDVGIDGDFPTAFPYLHPAHQ
jgi:hypothetical protein